MNVLLEENIMSMAGDPIRLRRMVLRGSLLERGLDAAQASGPTDEQLQALERRVLVGLGATTAAAAAVTIARTAGSQTAGTALGWLSSGSAKLIVTLVATVTAGGGSVAVWHATGHRAPSRAAVASPTHPSPGVSGPRPEVPAILPSPAPVVTSESRARWARPAQEPAISPPPSTGTFRKVSRTRESVRETPDEELSLLARANRALVKSPALALTLADEHTRRFPESGMDQERELIAITALIDLGQIREAQRRAAEFTRIHPGSLYQSRIDKALAPHR